MFYRKCTCGGKVVSAEPEHIEAGKRHTRLWLQREAATGHAHPVLKGVALALTVGHEIYKRIPGWGGLKVCTRCGDEFR
jgi:hypothetical protein